MIRHAVLALFALTMTVNAAVKIEKTAYKGWPNCYRLSNGEVELIVTTDVGPRVIRYGFVGGQNIFKEFDEQMGKTGESKWMPRGGHRIWFAPEDIVLSYPADNFPVKAEVHADSISLTAPVEPETGLQKTIEVKLNATGSGVRVIHRIRNTREKVFELAPWTLTMMAQGGTAITGFPPRGTHPEMLAPTNPLVMFAFTDFSDKRFHFTKKYLILKQDPKNATPNKAGLFNPHTWGAYLLGSDLFIKQYQADPKATYPDRGASYETFTNAEFLELETLGPLVKLKQNEATDHVEMWTLHKNIKIDTLDDAHIDRVLLPLF
jgi:hypothetical protein